MNDLKKRELQVLEFMKKNIKEKGYPPTVREICQALEIKSTSTVHKDLDSLEKKGYLKKDPSKPRAIMITGLSDESEETKKNVITSTQNEREDIADIPLVGRIAAGTPILAEQNIEEFFPIPSRFLGKKNNFMLKVKGESMINVGIFDGDYILVEENNVADNGEIVVAMIDEVESEATVKTFYKEKNNIRLQPENFSMEPIIVKDVKILGKVKGVFRYF